MRELRTSQRLSQEANENNTEKIRNMEVELADSQERVLELSRTHEDERRRLQSENEENKKRCDVLEERLIHERAVTKALSQQNEKLMETTQKATDLVARGIPPLAPSATNRGGQRFRRSPSKASSVVEGYTSNVVPAAMVESLQKELDEVRLSLRTLQQEVHNQYSEQRNKSKLPLQSKHYERSVSKIATVNESSIHANGYGGRSDIERLLMIQEGKWSPSSLACNESVPSHFGAALSQIDNDLGSSILSTGKPDHAYDSLLDIVDSMEDSAPRKR